MGRKKVTRSKEEKRAARRHYEAALRQKHVEAGLCVNCSRPAEGGLSRCAKCRESVNRSRRAYWERVEAKKEV